MKWFSLVSLICSLPLAAAVETRQFESRTIKEVDVRNLSGRIEISGTHDESASVSANRVTEDEKCRVEMKQDGSRLIARVDRRGFFRGGECKVDLVLRVPAEADLSVRNGSGSVDIKNARGTVEYRLGSGDLKINGRVKKVEGSSGSGSAEINGILGSGRFRMGSGNLMLRYAAIPTESDLDIRTGSGDAEVLLPPTTKVLAQSFTGSGHVVNELGDSKDAKFKVSFKSGSGNLNIKKK